MSEESIFEKTRQRLLWTPKQGNTWFKCLKYGIFITGCHKVDYMAPCLDECEKQCGVKPKAIKAPRTKRKGNSTPKKPTPRKIVRKSIRKHKHNGKLVKKGVSKHVRRNKRNPSK